jgi:hypothetical protein
MIIIQRAGGTYKWTKVRNQVRFCVHRGMAGGDGVVVVVVVVHCHR